MSGLDFAAPREVRVRYRGDAFMVRVGEGRILLLSSRLVVHPPPRGDFPLKEEERQSSPRKRLPAISSGSLCASPYIA